MDEKIYKRDKRSPVPKNPTVSKVMSRIKGKNTKPELILRKYLWSNGIRGYRLNVKNLPGKPDMVFTKSKVAIFIHGCYWHGCEICGWKAPKHNTEYWVNKIGKNKARDNVNKEKLEELGFIVLTLWEHEIKGGMIDLLEKLRAHIKRSKIGSRTSIT